MKSFIKRHKKSLITLFILLWIPYCIFFPTIALVSLIAYFVAIFLFIFHKPIIKHFKIFFSILFIILLCLFPLQILSGIIVLGFLLIGFSYLIIIFYLLFGGKVDFSDKDWSILAILYYLHNKDK